MAVFTAIATAVTNALLIAGGGFLGSSLLGTALATATGYIVAGGLAVATARALGIIPEMPGAGKDPGVTVQLAPNTDNKLAIHYGKAFTSGPIFDAAISNQNQTMTYCIALSENTQSGDFTVGSIFMNDVELIFSGNTVISHRDPNQSTATNYNGKIRVNVYQGGSSGSDVVFPASGTGASTPASTIVPHWGVLHTANEMVFAVVQIDYDAENGLTGLPNFTFELTNSLKNPGDVLYDYLTSNRYGAGLSNAQLDINSITGTSNVEMKGYCDELVSYTNKANVTTTNKRYEVNGVLSTFNTSTTNIDTICQAAATYFTFDVKQGKFRAIPNRQISTAEKANCYVFNDDNIVSKIDISSTELYSLYNGVEVEFADQNRKDQTNTILVETPVADRNANEPENVLNYRIDLINDNIRAERLANIDLNQSRNSTVVQFVSDYAGIQTDVGDVIKLTNTLYGWDEKLFRALRTTERQDETGMLYAEITALEYQDSYYTDPDITETPDLGNIDLPRIPIIPPIYIPQAYTDGYSNISALPGNIFGNVIVNDAMQVFGAGAQLENAGLTNTNVDSGTVYKDLITPEVYDISGVDIGDYTFDAFGNLAGVIPPGGFQAAFRNNVTINFANTTSQANYVAGGGGITLESTGIPPQLNDNKKISLDPTTHGLPADMLPRTATIKLQGYTTLDDDTANGYPRAVGNMKYEMKRITKGERE